MPSSNGCDKVRESETEREKKHGGKNQNSKTTSLVDCGGHPEIFPLVRAPARRSMKGGIHSERLFF